MIELTFIGGAQTVTGSKHLLKTSRAAVLLDCGMFQGRRHESFEMNRNIPLDVTTLDAVILSHAHIDHSGALPLTVACGHGRGPFVAPRYVVGELRIGSAIGYLERLWIYRLPSKRKILSLSSNSRGISVSSNPNSS